MHMDKAGEIAMASSGQWRPVPQNCSCQAVLGTAK